MIGSSAIHNALRDLFSEERFHNIPRHKKARNLKNRHRQKESSLKISEVGPKWLVVNPSHFSRQKHFWSDYQLELLSGSSELEGTIFSLSPKLTTKNGLLISLALLSIAAPYANARALPAHSSDRSPAAFQGINPLGRNILLSPNSAHSKLQSSSQKSVGRLLGGTLKRRNMWKIDRKLQELQSIKTAIKSTIKQLKSGYIKQLIATAVELNKGNYQKAKKSFEQAIQLQAFFQLFSDAIEAIENQLRETSRVTNTTSLEETVETLHTIDFLTKSAHSTYNLAQRTLKRFIHSSMNSAAPTSFTTAAPIALAAGSESCFSGAQEEVNIAQFSVTVATRFIREIAIDPRPDARITQVAFETLQANFMRAQRARNLIKNLNISEDIQSSFKTKKLIQVLDQIEELNNTIFRSLQKMITTRSTFSSATELPSTTKSPKAGTLSSFLPKENAASRREENSGRKLKLIAAASSEKPTMATTKAPIYSEASERLIADDEDLFTSTERYDRNAEHEEPSSWGVYSAVAGASFIAALGSIGACLGVRHLWDKHSGSREVEPEQNERSRKYYAMQQLRLREDWSDHSIGDVSLSMTPSIQGSQPEDHLLLITTV